MFASITKLKILLLELRKKQEGKVNSLKSYTSSINFNFGLNAAFLFLLLLEPYKGFLFSILPFRFRLLSCQIDSRGQKLTHKCSTTGVDVILDNIGGSYFQRNLDSLNIDGRLFIIGFMGGTVTQVNLASMLAKRLTVQGMYIIPFV